jgi:hypothetical protein
LHHIAASLFLPLEIIAPAHVTVEQINAMLAPLSVSGMTPEEFAPLRAA